MRFPNLSETVSVVIYGGSNGNAAVASAFAQTHKPREVIVITDDRSSTPLNTMKVLQEEHPELIVINQPSESGNSSRDAGLKAATGKWIQFIDGDTVLLPQKIESQVAFACSEPDVNTIIGSYQEVDSAHNIIRTVIEVACPDIYIALMRGRAGRTSSQLYRRSAVLQAGGWKPSVYTSQEDDLLYRVSRLGGIAKFDTNPLTQVRINSIQTPQLQIAANIRSRFDFRITIFEALSHEAYPYQAELRQALFEAIRIAYPHDRMHALEALRHYLPQNYKPTNNSLYAFAYSLFGFDGAERLANLSWSRH